ncbi:Uu.00g141840.m01.CDS01 [Anthostomella pinea]|uniref:Uu.00g141840.m01.CDS01 n=1 Tax=Anthostomella pinea TaxID=933095 RepID=A0AAI8VQD0_9PEZI|nr:Uu.00g141840.m01.CDS01 [Anthostomella pinea]
MPGTSSSVGVNLGGCSSDPHTATGSAAEHTPQQEYQPPPVQPRSEDVVDRLVHETPYDHQAHASAHIATFADQFSGPGGSDCSGGNNTGH